MVSAAHKHQVNIKYAKNDFIRILKKFYKLLS